MSATPAAPRARVLVAGNDYAARRRLEDMLTALGADVDTAADGLGVLGLIRKRAYDVVFMDSAMPVMDGVAAARILRTDSRFRRLPLVAMREEADSPASAEEGRRLLEHFSEVLPTPPPAEALHAALLRHVGPERLRAASEETPPAACAGARGDHAPPPHTNEKKAPHAMEETQLHHLDGFDVDQGLARVLGNEKLYTRLLRDFERYLRESDGEIHAAEQAGDMPELLAAIHKLKGMSGNVAATRLYTHVVELEKQFRAEPDMGPADRRRLEAFFALLGRTIADVAAFNAAERPAAAEPSSPPAPAPAGADASSDPELRRLLEESLRRTGEYATSALESFREARGRLGAREEQRQRRIEALLESFEFEEAGKELLALTRSLGIANISKYEQS